MWFDFFLFRRSVGHVYMIRIHPQLFSPRIIRSDSKGAVVSSVAYFSSSSSGMDAIMLKIDVAFIANDSARL